MCPFLQASRSQAALAQCAGLSPTGDFRFLPLFLGDCVLIMGSSWMKVGQKSLLVAPVDSFNSN